MKKLALIICLSLYSLIASAQSKVTLTGKVIDSVSHVPLERATVAVVDAKDSTLITYTLSKENGEFTLYGLALNKPLRLSISYAAYDTYRKPLNFTKGGSINLGDIGLNVKILDEVIINADAPPVVIKKDTIEFNADAFKTKPNAVLEELLKKLPGVQVNRDGSILVNGKSVSKLMIDGKEFFGTDPKIATKNLDAEYVAKIQVYDDREDDPNHLKDDIDVNKIINIKLKKAIKRSIFGKVYTGGGTRDRYEAGGLFNMFRDTLQVSVLALTNNLNRTGFSTDELYSDGGFNRSGGDALWNGTINTGGQNWGGGIEKVATGGVNINNNYGKKLKLNLMYFYSEGRKLQQTDGLTQTFLNDTTVYNSSSSSFTNNRFSHNISGLVEWVPDTLVRLTYRPTLNFGNDNNNNSGSGKRYNQFNPKVNESSFQNKGGSNNTSFNHNFMFYRRGKTRNQESITINNNISISPNKSNNLSYNTVTSFVNTVPSFMQNRISSGDNRAVSGTLSVSYRYPLSKKFVVDINDDANYTDNKQRQLVLDYDTVQQRYDIIVADQTTNLRRTQWNHTIRPGITWDLTKKIKLTASVNAQWQSFTDDFDTLKQSRSNFFWLPIIRLNLAKWTITYSRSVNQPDISSLRPVTIVYSPQSTFIGNPNLKPSETDRYGLSFNNYNHDRNISYYLWSSVRVTKNQVVYKSIINADGPTISTPINANRAISADFSGQVSKSFNKSKTWNFSVNSRFGGYYTQRLNYINDNEGLQHSTSWNIGPGASVSWKEYIDFETHIDFRQNYTRYTYENGRNQNFNNLNMNNNLTIEWPEKWVTEVKQDFVYNSQTAAGFRKINNIVSASIARRLFKKDMGEVKLTVYDLFDQNISVYRYTGSNSIFDQQTNTLQRYFLLTYTYRFKAMKTN